MRQRLSGESKKGRNLAYGLRYARVIAHTYRREHAAARTRTTTADSTGSTTGTPPGPAPAAEAPGGQVAARPAGPLADSAAVPRPAVAADQVAESGECRS
jgi:hypothetical protein